MPGERLEISRFGIAKLIKDGNLAVPPNQREYAWKKEHVTDLFQDLAKAIHDEEPDYFLGSVVVARKNGGSLRVFDGQQRLATTMILLAAIRDYYSSHNDEDRAKIISDDYLSRVEGRTLDELPKFVLSKTDHEFFMKRIVSKDTKVREAAKPATISHQRIDEAAKIAAKHVDALVAVLPEGSKGTALWDWVDFLQERAMVICVQVPDDSTAYVVFETMNDRGLRPSAADLLKNHLFGIADNRIEEAENYWVSMTGTLTTVPGAEEDIVVTYIRHLWISQHGPTRTKDLFDRIKREVKGKQDAIDLSAALANSASLYAAMLNPSHNMWNPFGPSASKSIATLQDLGVEQLRPLMLSVLDKFKPMEVVRFLQALVNWTVRFLITGQIGGGALEAEYGKRALEVHHGTITTAKQIATAMAGIIPVDSAFEAQFSNVTVSKPNLARYYLRALQRKEDGKDSEPQYVPSDEAGISLEHILPQSPSSDWKIDLDILRANWQRIGNLVLLQTSQNNLVANGSYLSKKGTLAKSYFSLTREAASHTKWGVDEIGARQARLAELAVQTWPLKPL